MLNIFQNKKIRNFSLFATLIVVAVAFGLFFPQGAAHAEDSGLNWIESILSNILLKIVELLARLLVQVIHMLVSIAQYNNFINATAVVKGWVIVRDVCNMLFIAILLVIAFGTIFKWETYRYNRLLGKLVLMAFLINFSKFICGFFIDFFQVMMLTFVNAFASVAAGNFINGLHLADMVSFRSSIGTDVSVSGVFGAMLLAITLLLIAVVVMVVITIFLLFRIMMLWILVVLSPLAFVLRAWPGRGERFASEWWEQFTSNLTSGPILAFFIWLSLSVMTVSGGNINNEGFKSPGATTGEETGTIVSTDTATDTRLSSALNKISESDTLLSFIISIALMMGSLMMAQRMGGMGGQLAGQALGGIQKRLGSVMRYGAAGAAGGLIGVGAYRAWQKRRQVAGVAVTGMAKSDRLKNTLASVASNRVTGRIPFLRGYAEKAYVGLGAFERKEQEKAESYAKNIKDTRIMRRIANQTALTPWQSALKSAVRDLDPSLIKDPANAQKHMNKMSKEKWGKVSDNTLAALGARGIALTGTGRAFAERDADARGAYNTGLRAAGVAETGWLVGTDRYGTPIRPVTSPGVWGSMPNHPRVGFRPGDAQFEDKLLRQGSYANKYRMVSPEERGAQGEGNLSVNRFSRGQDQTVGVDLGKLSPEAQKKILEGSGESNLKNIKGVNITDKEQIRTLAKDMVNVIDQEMLKLKQTGGNEARLGHLEKAREKFSNPASLEKLDSINVINSGAAGYKISDLKNTKIHEEMHGFGVNPEEATSRLTEHIMQNKLYSQRKTLAEGYVAGQSAQDVIRREKGMGPAIPPEVTGNKDIQKQLDEFEHLIKASGGAGGLEPKTFDNIASGLKQMTEQLKGMGKTSAHFNQSAVEPLIHQATMGSLGRLTPQQLEEFNRNLRRLITSFQEAKMPKGLASSAKPLKPAEPVGKNNPPEPTRNPAPKDNQDNFISV